MVPRIFYPLLPYRSIAYPFLVLSSITVPCWLFFRLYRLRIRSQSLSFRRELLLLTVVVYLSGLAAATLIPSHPSRSVAAASAGIEVQPNLVSLTCSSASMPTGSTARSFCVRNARGNVILFIPLGILLPLVWRRLRFWKALQIAIALSLGIELVQFVSRAFGSQRTADVNDVILNVVGACIGLGLVSLLRFAGEAVPRFRATDAVRN